MSRSLPPLNALRAFETAARCGNFTRAAKELFVTQGAVSRHVATLEEWLGVKLFERDRYGIILTAEGKAYHASISEAFEQIRHSTRQLQHKPNEWLLRIKVPPTFAIRWLIPRLARFHAKHPRIEVQITTSHQPTDLMRDDVDAAIHSESSPPQGPGYRLLFQETLLPVCAPSLLSRGPALHHPDDLCGHTLLSSLNRPQDWPIWLDAAGRPDIDHKRGLAFENAAMAYQAAAEGLGVMMGLQAFARSDLAEGRLVAPLDLLVPTGRGYFMAWRTDRPVPQRLLDFENWIVEELAAAQG